MRLACADVSSWFERGGSNHRAFAASRVALRRTSFRLISLNEAWTAGKGRVFTASMHGSLAAGKKRAMPTPPFPRFCLPFKSVLFGNN